MEALVGFHGSILSLCFFPVYRGFVGNLKIQIPHSMHSSKFPPALSKVILRNCNFLDHVGGYSLTGKSLPGRWLGTEPCRQMASCQKIFCKIRQKSPY